MFDSMLLITVYILMVLAPVLIPGIIHAYHVAFPQPTAPGRLGIHAMA